jgi:hypothetical protein
VREKPIQEETLKPSGRRLRTVLGPSLSAAHADAERFDQPAVLHARRACCLATAAIEAQVEVPFDGRPQFEAAIRHGSHQIDAAPWAIVLVPCFEVRRAGRRAQATMDAVEKTAVIDIRADAFARRHGWLGTGLAL